MDRSPDRDDTDTGKKIRPLEKIYVPWKKT